MAPPEYERHRCGEHARRGLQKQRYVEVGRDDVGQSVIVHVADGELRGALRGEDNGCAETAGAAGIAQEHFEIAVVVAGRDHVGQAVAIEIGAGEVERIVASRCQRWRREGAGTGRQIALQIPGVAEGVILDGTGADHGGVAVAIEVAGRQPQRYLARVGRCGGM